MKIKKKWEHRRHKVSRDIVSRCGHVPARRILKKTKKAGGGKVKKKKENKRF